MNVLLPPAPSHPMDFARLVTSPERLSFLEGLRRDVATHEETLRRVTQALRQDILVSSEVILDHSVCGAASRTLDIILKKLGYDSETVYSDILPRDLGTRGHVFVRVHPPRGKPVSLDPTYKQFLDGLCLPRDHLPRDNVLIFDRDTLPDVARWLAYHRWIKWNSVPSEQRGELPRLMPLMALAPEALEKKFAALWDESRYFHDDNRLLSGVATYLRDPQSLQGHFAKFVQAYAILAAAGFIGEPPRVTRGMDKA